MWRSQTQGDTLHCDNQDGPGANTSEELLEASRTGTGPSSHQQPPRPRPPGARCAPLPQPHAPPTKPTFCRFPLSKLLRGLPVTCPSCHGNSLRLRMNFSFSTVRDNHGRSAWCQHRQTNTTGDGESVHGTRQRAALRQPGTGLGDFTRIK